MVIKWGPLERVRFTTQAIIVPIEHPRFPDFGPYRIRTAACSVSTGFCTFTCTNFDPALARMSYLPLFYINSGDECSSL